jgi:hypothetical protein
MWVCERGGIGEPACLPALLHGIWKRSQPVLLKPEHAGVRYCDKTNVMKFPHYAGVSCFFSLVFLPFDKTALRTRQPTILRSFDIVRTRYSSVTLSLPPSHNRSPLHSPLLATAMLSLEAHPAAILLLLVVSFVGWLSSRWIYNLYFHPLAHIPGPKLAAATYLYQTYYSLIGGSRYYRIIKQLHQIYGRLLNTCCYISLLTHPRTSNPHHA